MQAAHVSTRATVEDDGVAPRRLTVLYDDLCPLCVRCRDWLARQPCLVEVELLPARSSAVRERYGELPWVGRDLVVIDDRRRAWVGSPAFIVCLWATARYRVWAYRFARRPFAPITARVLAAVSKHRGVFGAWLSSDETECPACSRLDPHLRRA